MVQQSDELFMIEAIRLRVRTEIAALIEDEVRGVEERILQRIRSKADALALELAAEYDVVQKGTNVIITVRKKA